MYWLCTIYMYVHVCVWGGGGGERELSVLACLIIALCFKLRTITDLVFGLVSKRICSCSTDTSLYRVYAVGGAKSACTVRSSTAGLMVCTSVRHSMPACCKGLFGMLQFNVCSSV